MPEMPVFYEHINDFAKIAIWHIAEEKNFFLQKVFLHRSILHPHKQLQHLAGRYLLQHLYPDFPHELIEIADTNKPFLANEEYHFSISHCGDYAAVIVSKDHRVGIDIEMVTPKVEKVKHKFLNEEEMSIVNGEWPMSIHQSTNKLINQLTLLWCCKEAVFKWYGSGGVNFKKNINLLINTIDVEKGILKCEFNKEVRIMLDIHFTFFEELCLAWVVSN